MAVDALTTYYERAFFMTVLIHALCILFIAIVLTSFVWTYYHVHSVLQQLIKEAEATDEYQELAGFFDERRGNQGSFKVDL